MKRINLVSPIVLLLSQAVALTFNAGAETVREFEVVSIRQTLARRGIQLKPWSPTFQCPPDYHCGLSGNLFQEVAVSVEDLIIDAYKVKRYQIVGLPSWASSGGNLYDLRARLAEGTAPSVDEARLMLQSVLARRFQLRLRHETRELPLYVIVAGKGGVKVRAGQSLCGINGGVADKDSNEASSYRYPWSFFAQMLSIYTDRPVVDETGLDGVGYCTTDGKNPTQAIAEEIQRGASVFAAVADQWGMRLESRRTQVDVLMIERVTLPSEN